MRSENKKIIQQFLIFPDVVAFKLNHQKLRNFVLMDRVAWVQPQWIRMFQGRGMWTRNVKQEEKR